MQWTEDAVTDLSNTINHVRHAVEQAGVLVLADQPSHAQERLDDAHAWMHARNEMLAAKANAEDEG